MDVTVKEEAGSTSVNPVRNPFRVYTTHVWRFVRNGTLEQLNNRKETAKTGDEVDMVTGWRKVTNNHWKRIKQRMSRRNRRRARRILRQLRKDETP